jgi:sugar phosphate isomerase/epimerase
MRLAFSSLACPGWTVERIADAATRYGYDAIEWRLADGELLSPRTPDDVWERIATCGVATVCLDTSAVFVQGNDDERAKQIAHAKVMGKRAAQIGAEAIRVFGGAMPEGLSFADILEPTRRALAKTCESIPSDVSCLIETHDSWSKGADVASLIRGLGGIHVLWDVAHTWRAGESPRDTLAAIGVPGLVHVKDADRSRLVRLGDGSVPLREVVAELHDIGYDGALSLEWEKLWHPELDEPDVVLPRSIEYLRELVS